MQFKRKLVVFTGAGMSAESGIQTFRDSGGLWEKYKIEDVATPDAWHRNQGLVLDFYNQRRRQIIQAMPNTAHKLLASLQKQFDVHIITQNIDDLHERAGSKKVLHLHGEIMKARSTKDPALLYKLDKTDILMGDTCEKGSQLRPHIVWFGEIVPEMDNAAMLVSQADIFVTIGTSLNVYPAAGLLSVSPGHIPKYLIDPGNFNLDYIQNLIHIRQTAVEGTKQLAKLLTSL